jgi:hypothetical protein
MYSKLILRTLSDLPKLTQGLGLGGTLQLSDWPGDFFFGTLMSLR